jgi:hypothetical protein
MVNFVRGGVRLYDHPNLRAVEAPAHLDADERIAAAAGAGAATPTTGGDTYLTAVLKLVPAEIITLYMAVRDSASAHQSLRLWFIICAVACLILRGYASLPKSAKGHTLNFKDPQWIGVVISVVAFYLWAYATGAGPEWPSLLKYLQPEQWLASAMAGILGILAPLVVPGDPNTADGS